MLIELAFCITQYMIYMIELQKLKEKKDANKNKKFEEHNEGKSGRHQEDFSKKILTNKQKQKAIHSL